MRKYLVWTSLLAVSASAAVVSAPMEHPQSSQGHIVPVTVINADTGTSSRVDRDESYDFEGSDQGWASHGTGMETDVWHVEAAGFGGTTDVWWGADAANGGYVNSTFAWLQTPALDFSAAAAPSLAFDLYYACEAPGGEPVGYDGWDGCNVWVSTDGGTTFSVVSGSPAYNVTSSYAFGVEFGMGEGIPQWGNTAAGWTAASFDLSAYAGLADVRVRWVMCSDPAYDVVDNPAMIGMQIDNVVISDGGTLWADDGTSNTGGAAEHGYYIFGDAWWFTGFDWNCPNDANLGGYVESPWIAMTPPALLQLSQDIRCDLPDSDGNDDGFLEDYFHIEYTVDGVNWETLTYDYAGDTRPDWMAAYYTYTNADVFNGGLNFTESSATQFKLRYRITTDGDDDGGQGTGLWVDNVNVIIASVPPVDMAVTKAWIDYPRNVNEFQFPKVELSNQGADPVSNLRAYWQVKDSLGTVIRASQPVNLTATAVDPLTSVRVEQTATAPATWKWMPTAAGTYSLEFYTTAVGDADNSNDTLYVDVFVFNDNEGLLRYDYDLSSAWTLSAGGDDGAMVRFDPIDEPWTAQFFAATLYNVVAGDVVSIVIHDEGVDDATPGPLLAQYYTTVIDETEIYPNTFFRYMGIANELRCIDHPIWIGIRTTEFNAIGVVGLSAENGGPYWEQHTYGYDYALDEAYAWNGDLRIWMQVDWGVESAIPYTSEVVAELTGSTYNLSWDSPGPVDGYLVYRSTNAYDFTGATVVADLPASTTTFSDTVTSGPNFYRVIGYNGLCPAPVN
jgi:hypothetical protein